MLAHVQSYSFANCVYRDDALGISSSKS
ncbi:hypothetical protein [Vibrio scophthalmi]